MSYIEGYSFGVVVRIRLLRFSHLRGSSYRLYRVQTEIERFVFVISIFVAELLDVSSMQEKQYNDGTHNGNPRESIQSATGLDQKSTGQAIYIHCS